MAALNVAGTLRVPGDKSISHRSLILSALASGSSRVTNILASDDVKSTASVLRVLGADVPPLSADFVVRGGGPSVFRAPDRDLDCGNSGTTTRLLAGVVAALPVTARFVGDASLSRRPMRRVARPLEAMGARVELPPHGGLPMVVHGGSLHALDWHSEVASAQIKSAVLLAAVVSGVAASVTEPARSRDHTERMLSARGVSVDVAGHVVRVAAGSSLRALDLDVPGDPSSAAFFVGLASLARGGEIALRHVCVNETRAGFFRAVARMGATVEFVETRVEGGESVADIVARPGRLRGITIDEAEVPSMIDELPLLACIASRADGETVITGASELRVKESDRVTAVVNNLRAIGAVADELPDGMRITGSTNPLRGRVVTHGDHRLAMSFGVLGALPGNEIEIDDPECVSVSYPGFWDDLRRSVR